MSLIREVFAGYAQRVRLENSLQLQKSQQVRPEQIKMEIAAIHSGITKELAADPDLKAAFDKVVITVPA